MGLDGPCAFDHEGEVQSVLGSVVHVEVDVTAKADDDTFEPLFLVLALSRFFTRLRTRERAESGAFSRIDVERNLFIRVFSVVGGGGRRRRVQERGLEKPCNTCILHTILKGPFLPEDTAVCKSDGVVGPCEYLFTGSTINSWDAVGRVRLMGRATRGSQRAANRAEKRRFILGRRVVGRRCPGEVGRWGGDRATK